MSPLIIGATNWPKWGVVKKEEQKGTKVTKDILYDGTDTRYAPQGNRATLIRDWLISFGGAELMGVEAFLVLDDRLDASEALRKGRGGRREKEEEVGIMIILSEVLFSTNYSV